MERLPFEMVKKISGYLTPQDLARCSAMCHTWREMFRDDCYWRPHCDPELAEELRNTPCVVEPVFVSPEDTNNTSLTPIGHWRLAFMREKHLWKNLRQDNHKIEHAAIINNESRREILTNRLVVRWCSDRIEIWDVSVTPIVFVARTDPSVDLSGSLYRYVIGSSVLLVEQTAQIKVFHVDTLNNHVELRHNIPLNEANHSLDDCTRVVKHNIYVRVNPSKLSFEIFDLETGGLRRMEPCPAMGNGNEKTQIRQIKSYPASDILIVLVRVLCYPMSHHYLFYNLRQLTFFPGPKVDSRRYWDDHFAIHRHYLAIVVDVEALTVKVYDCNTLEVIYNQTYGARVEMVRPCVFNNSFLFKLNDSEGQGLLEMFSPMDREIRTIVIHPNIEDVYFGTIHNKILYTHACISSELVGVWKVSGGSLRPYDFRLRYNLRFNRALTRGMLTGPQLMMSIYHYW